MSGLGRGGRTRKADQAGNVTIARRSLAVDATNNILISEDEHLVAALGVRDLVIVHARTRRWFATAITLKPCVSWSRWPGSATAMRTTKLRGFCYSAY